VENQDPHKTKTNNDETTRENEGAENVGESGQDSNTEPSVQGATPKELIT
jgi:hypothetical protein